MSHLSQSQAGVFYALQNPDGENTNYQIPFLYSLPKEIDLDRLEKALDAVASAHPYLFSHLEIKGGEVEVVRAAAPKVKRTYVEKIDRAALAGAIDLEKEPFTRIEIISSKDETCLLLDFHHIAMDGSANAAFNEDLEKAYAGEAIAAEDFDGDAVADEEEALRQTPAFEEQRQWYLKEFAPADELESLPSPVETSDRGIKETSFQLNLSVEEAKALCKKFGARKSTVFSVAWAKLLANFTGQDKACFSTIFNGRTPREARTATMMVRTLPVYVELPSGKPLEEVVKAFSAQQDAVREKTAYSFSDLHSEMDFRGDNLFAYQGPIGTADSLKLHLAPIDLPVEDLRLPRPGTVLDAQMFETPSEGGDYTLRISYDTGRYPESMVRGMVESYQAILKSMLAAETVSDLEAASQSQIKVLDGFNPKTAPKEFIPVAKQFLERAAARPEAICCVAGGKRFTYETIANFASSIAERLKSSNAPVCFICERNEMMVVYPLAIALAGRACQPLDSSYPDERLEFMVKDSAADIMLCPTSLKDRVPGFTGERMITNSVEEVKAKMPRIEVKPDDTFILLYTSGTTGTPKGVMITQANLASFNRANVKYVGLEPDSVYASYASYGFDAFLMDIWAVLTCGAQIHIIGDDIRFDLVGIENYFEKESITHAFMTTQIGTQMAVNFPDIPGLKLLGVGGEKLSSIVPPKYRLVNMYGPTECTIYITVCDVRKQEKNIPIGPAAAENCLFVVNKDGKRVPQGAEGELWVAGPQVGKGYLNLPEKTARAFISNPFGEGKVYRTGDIVRYREDGQIEFIGRKDGQVKIRGFRIETKEVESVIREFPGVKDVTVQPFDIEAGGKAIAAYIVCDGTLDSEALGGFIAQTKPSYMVPAVMMQLETIPLNVNGKVDKKKLPEPKITVAEKKDAPAAPLNVLEEELKGMIVGLTGCEDFDITTQLRYLGLSSISSLRLSTEIYKRCGVNVSSRDLGQGASLQSVENVILSTMMSRGEPRIKAAEKPAVTKAPLTGAQTGVYYECLKNPSSTVYNIPQRIVFPAGTSSRDIADATLKAIAAHPALSFHFTEDAFQEPMEGFKPEVAILEKEPLDFVRPFDLGKGPLYRAAVVGNVLLFDAHHLVMDGSSVRVLVRQICDCLEGRPVTAEELGYLEYAAGERDWSDAEKYFDSQLSTVDGASEIPADLHGQEAEGRAVQAVRKVNHAAVEQYARKAGLTPAAIYLAALEYLAARYSSAKDVCIATVSSGRGDNRIAGTVGMFVNTLALVSHISDQSVKEYVSDVSRSLRDTMEFECYPFAKVAERFSLDPGLIFVYQMGLLGSLTVGGEEVSLETMELSAPKFKLSIMVEQRGADVCLVAEYNDALYSGAMMDRLLESMEAVVMGMISGPEGKISALSIMSPAQKAEVGRMNFVCNSKLPVRLLHRGFEIHAAETPDEIALIAADRTLTYAQLDSDACAVANHLLSRGLRKGDAVVALLPRNSRTIASILGIMKAGGAFIPCDPEYPTDRIRLIVEDSGAPFVLTTAALVGEYGDKGICMDDVFTNPDRTPVDAGVLPEDLAYMIYTSGSTGRPKGVCVEHRNITTFVTNCPEHPCWSMTEKCRRLCSVATISFDAFIFDFAMSLFNGRTLVFSSEVESKDPIALAALMKRTQADYFCCTSSRFMQYLELPDFVEALRNCKAILQGGEKFSETLLERLRAIIPNAALLNGYGPTEVSICCNACDLRHSPSVTVGRPVPNYTEWIIDADCNELPVGVVGELCVGGEGITRGYRNLPEKTAEKYITYKGMRAFRTGDYARWTADGEVEILGRTDNQVKLRGLRIELGEVESAITRVAGVKSVLVKICTIRGREHLSAYYVADRTISPDELKKTISSTLTAYMVPTAYLQMGAFPITPNGKVDFRHLPEPQLYATASDYVAPKGEVETYFAGLFGEILGLEKVSATDSFFDLGGTSLIVMKVVINAQAAGYTLTYADVFAHPSARELASMFASDSAERDDTDADVRDYNYDRIDALIANNNLETFLSGQSSRPLGDVLLTGATGFLGIHILRYLLESHSATTVHCLLRPKKGVHAAERLHQMLFYYFETDFGAFADGRVRVHDGDVTAPIYVSDHIDTVINCAALVKHFSSGTQIEDVNVGGARNCVEYCLRNASRLIQISTYSVGGSSVDGVPETEFFNERMLYVGQTLHNQYIHSKIMAERLILEAVATKGLDAKIMRVGNLSARAEDGEFQINVKSNSFMGRLNIYQMLGALPYSLFQSKLEFSPIDDTARAICLLATTPGSLTIFHPHNNHCQMLGDVLGQMKTIDKEVRLVEDDKFVSLLSEAKKDPSKSESLASLLAYEGNKSDGIARPLQSDNEFTIQVLLRLGFRWDPTSWDYVDRFLKQIDTLQYFE